MLRNIAGRLAVLAAGAALASCALATQGGGAAAPFLAASSAVEMARLHAPAELVDNSTCVVMARFEGVARPRNDQLEVVISKGWVALTRNNNKRMDDLHLGVGTSWSANDASTMVLTPTVDTAGPSITTWESQGPLLVTLPRPADNNERLHFFVAYHALGYDGRYVHCENVLTTDTLRVASR